MRAQAGALSLCALCSCSCANAVPYRAGLGRVCPMLYTPASAVVAVVCRDYGLAVAAVVLRDYGLCASSNGQASCRGRWACQACQTCPKNHFLKKVSSAVSHSIAQQYAGVACAGLAFGAMYTLVHRHVFRHEFRHAYRHAYRSVFRHVCRHSFSDGHLYRRMYTSLFTCLFTCPYTYLYTCLYTSLYTCSRTQVPAPCIGFGRAVRPGVITNML